MATKNKTEDRFLTRQALASQVAEAIARLELDRHQVNINVLMHGKDVQLNGPDGKAETAAEAVGRINSAIEEIENEYGDVLKGIEA